MKLNRRNFLSTLVAASSTFAPVYANESFPIFASETFEVDYKFRKREVAYETTEPVGTIIVDPHHRFLYFILGEGRAMRYGVGVGNRAASWSGTAIIKRKVEWPTWTPTPDQLAAHPVYAKWLGGMPGGPDNPLGARAMYLFQDDKDTLYRIHGTEIPSSVGKAVSSGCIRMINVDVADLYDRVSVGTRVIVLEDKSKKIGLFF